ncbi:hypothetical protein ACRRTK_009664 [Alexandromys fortis]
MNLDSHLRRSRKDSQTPSVPGCKTKAQRTSGFHLTLGHRRSLAALESLPGTSCWSLSWETGRDNQNGGNAVISRPPAPLQKERGGGSALPAPFPSLSLFLPPRPFTEPLRLAAALRGGPSVLLLRSWVAALLRTAESSLSGWFSLGFVPTAERGEVRLCDRYTGSSEMLGPALPAR